MSDKDTYFGVWAREKALTIRLAFAKFYDREPRKALEHVNAKLAEAEIASRLEEQRETLTTV